MKPMAVTRESINDDMASKRQCSHLLTIIVSCVTATLWTTPAPSRDASGSPEERTARLEDYVQIASKPSWDGSDRIVVAPTQINGKVYVPTDLPDAWQELDRMVPKNFLEFAAPLTPADCTYPYDPGDRTYFVVHNALISFVIEIWLKDRLSRFRKLFRREIQVLRPTDTRRMRDVWEGDFDVRVASWTVCTFYNGKRLGTYASMPEVISGIRRALALDRKLLSGSR